MSATERLTGSETVLVVDDNEDARNAMRRTLEWYGYRVLTAESPTAAREVAFAESGSRSIDLLVADVVMPEMTGPSLARALRENLPALRILLVSGYADPQTRGGELPGGHVGFLEKPMTINQLARAVRELLDRADEPEGGEV